MSVGVGWVVGDRKTDQRRDSTLDVERMVTKDHRTAMVMFGKFEFVPPETTGAG